MRDGKKNVPMHDAMRDAALLLSLLLADDGQIVRYEPSDSSLSVVADLNAEVRDPGSSSQRRLLHDRGHRQAG